MANLNDLINLAKADGGKFFVIDESGDAKLVIMSVEDYQRLLLGKLQRQVMDVEKINQEIVKAQLNENQSFTSAAPEPPIKAPTLKYQDPRQNDHHQSIDLRSEVIDPSFDFEGPKVEIDDL